MHADLRKLRKLWDFVFASFPAGVAFGAALRGRNSREKVKRPFRGGFCEPVSLLRFRGARVVMLEKGQVMAHYLDVVTGESCRLYVYPMGKHGIEIVQVGAIQGENSIR